MSTASRVASGLHKAVAFSLFGASLVGSGALLVTFGQSMVRRIAVRHRIPVHLLLRAGRAELSPALELIVPAAPMHCRQSSRSTNVCHRCTSCSSTKRSAQLQVVRRRLENRWIIEAVALYSRARFPCPTVGAEVDARYVGGME
jgi:hypothetical protein